ncbi:MAG: hypothetical protein HDS57_01730 [Barnesiella sp.]|nr:hypothetical protein [Barnesiella sp.]
MIKRLKAWLKERRIKRFRARLKEAYPDAEKFLSKVAWLDGTDQFIIDGIINVPDILLWTNPAHCEECDES